MDTKDDDVASTPASSPSLIENDEQKTLKAAYRKIDYRLLLWYSFVYLIMRINVSNITNTAIINVEDGTGIKKQLGHLISEQWAWALSIFYYPYMFAEPASTLLLKHFSPSVWMSRIMVSWGVVSMCQVATQNHGGILAARFLLGLAEAGFYPGVLYHLYFWYPAESIALRIACSYACGVFSGTISGLLVFAISYMNGVAGLAGWRHPAHSVWYLHLLHTSKLPGNNKIPVRRGKIGSDIQSVKDTTFITSKTWDTAQFKGVFKDAANTTFTFIWIFHAIGGWGISTVLPTVVYELGFSASAISQLLTIPTYAFGCTALVFSGWLIHTKRIQSWVAAIGLEVIAMISYIILIFIKNSIAKYIFVTVATACSICIYPILWPERTRATHGTTTAGLTIGMTNAAAQMAGIVGPQVYQSKFGPGYRIPFIISIALLAGATTSIGVTWWLVVKKDRTPEEKEDR